MRELKERIRAEGRYLGRGILKIDSILNHQIDPDLMMRMGEEFARRFAGVRVDRILTAEVSGIAPALTTGLAMHVPVVYARKHKPLTMSGPVYLEVAPSPTKGGEVMLLVSAEFLHEGEHILVLDDFLASGSTIEKLIHIVHSAGCKLAGIAAVVEKTFDTGREMLQKYGVPIETLVRICEMKEGEPICFED